MNHKPLVLLAFSLFGASLAPFAHADTVPIGIFSYDVTDPSDNLAQFDIAGFSGANSFDPTFPVTNTINLTDLTLTIHYSSGPDLVLGSSYFTATGDGESFNGDQRSTISGAPGFEGAVSATLTGDFSTTTWSLTDGTTVSVDPTFNALISDPMGLADLDSVLIEGTLAGSGTSPTSGATPEPGTFVLLGTGMAGLAALRRRAWASLMQSRSTGGMLGCTLLMVGLAVGSVTARADDSVKLNVLASPSTSLAGNVVSIFGSGFPAGTIHPASTTLTIASTCGGASVATATPTTIVTILGNTDRAQFTVPASLKTGTYYVSISGTSAGGTAFTSSDCSELMVTNSTATLAACVPTSSIAVTVGADVVAYVPFGYWEGGVPGIKQVALEGGSAPRSFTTSGVVNSCASNSVTKEVVCSENTTNVDLINGTTLTTLKSGSNGYASFSGGSCNNCGVAINPSNNTAVIAMGLSGKSSGEGVQTLDLTHNTFKSGFPMQNAVSENISIDSGRGLILSPGEGGVYDLMKIASDDSLTEYGKYVGGTLDSAAEDCTTGIALSAIEFTDNVYITDLTQAKFTSGSPAGTWTAPGQVFNLGDAGYSAGTSGITSAPGTGHLAVVTGEFGGSAYAVLKLPSTSGSGIPTLADYAYVAGMPSTPDGEYFSAGYDPHTITAYTSPNDGKSKAVFVDYVTGRPNYLGVVDLACVLSLPRTAGTHNVVGTASTCTRYVAIPAL